MEPLYCFKYDEELGEIEKIEISNYTIQVNSYTKRKTYCWTNPKINKCDTHYQLPEVKLDRYVNNKVYTFNPDIQNAKRIIIDTLLDKLEQAKEDFLKHTSNVYNFIEKFPEFDNEMEAT